METNEKTVTTIEIGPASLAMAIGNAAYHAWCGYPSTVSLTWRIRDNQHLPSIAFAGTDGGNADILRLTNRRSLTTILGPSWLKTLASEIGRNGDKRLDPETFANRRRNWLIDRAYEWVYSNGQNHLDVYADIINRNPTRYGLPENASVRFRLWPKDWRP